MAKRASGAMHVARVRRVHGDKEYVSVLLRQSYREGASVKHRTIASLTALPESVIEAIERSLRGERLVPADGPATPNGPFFETTRPTSRDERRGTLAVIP